MAGDVEGALRSAAARIASYVEDAATMTVITQYVTIGASGDANFDAAKPMARTTVRLDGDSEVVVPVREASTEPVRLELDPDLFAVHERNVAAATEYRARILQALVAGLPARLR